MKKKSLLIIMGLSIMLLASGCGKKSVSDDVDTTEATPTVTGAAEETASTPNLPDIEDYVASDYITLGQYKGVEVTVTKLNVTDEDVDAKVQEDLQANATQEEVKDRAVQKGDIVNIDYEGLLDGKAFDGGTAEGYDLEIGSGSFIEGFEEGLIGAKVGEKKALNLTFPADYSSADLAGKAVVFNVTVNSIKVSVVPELSEEYVTSNTDYKTIDEYKAGLRTQLEADNQTTMDNEKANNVMQAVLDGSTITSVPETLTNYYTTLINYQVEQEASYYGMEKDAYIEYVGMTQDDFASYIKEQVDFYGKYDLMLQGIVQAEKLELTDQEYKDAVANYMSSYGVTSEEELLKKVTEAQIKYSLIMQKAYDLVLENTDVAYE
ncbi:MAG: trigger factor [Herbinix sp.]|nr:trigger factor [Herbinix sp.]